MAYEGYRFVPDTQGQQRVLEDLAQGLDGFASSVVERAKAIAPFGTGVHLPRSRRPIFFYHYRDTIKASTYLQGRLIAGREVRATGFNPDRDIIHSIVYTTATPLGHIYEVTGAAPHDIPIQVDGPGFAFTVVIPHPGVSKRPHFVPGLLGAAASAGVTMRGRMLQKRGHG